MTASLLRETKLRATRSDAASFSAGSCTAAIVVPVDPGSLTEEDVLEHCRRRLSRFKVPTVVRFAEELPKTSIGKIRKDEVRKTLAGVEVPVR